MCYRKGSRSMRLPFCATRRGRSSVHDSFPNVARECMLRPVRRRRMIATRQNARSRRCPPLRTPLGRNIGERIVQKPGHLTLPCADVPFHFPKRQRGFYGLGMGSCTDSGLTAHRATANSTRRFAVGWLCRLPACRATSRSKTGSNPNGIRLRVRLRSPGTCPPKREDAGRSGSRRRTARLRCCRQAPAWF